MEYSFRILIFGALAWIVILILWIGSSARIRSMGTPPIWWPALLLAKTALGVSLLLMLLKAISGGAILSPLAAALFLAFLAGGILIFTAALFGLGRNLRMGLPIEETVLVTSGIYGFSRNPIYLGIFFMLGASLVYAFSWANLVSAAAGVLLHHRIIRAEEEFLSGQFKDYKAYCRRVRRYL